VENFWPVGAGAKIKEFFFWSCKSPPIAERFTFRVCPASPKHGAGSVYYSGNLRNFAALIEKQRAEIL
jgi:hypothetical protein